MREDTWRCHICDDERPDRVIKVYKRTRTLEGGGRFTENIRYCADRPACRDAAPTYSALKPRVTTPGDRTIPQTHSHGYEMGVGLIFIGLLAILLFLWWLFG